MRAIEILSLIIFGALSRLVPHVPNATALGGIALASRARFGLIGILIPIVSMLISDAVIGWYNWKLLVSVYASFCLMALLGRCIDPRIARRTSLIALIGSLLFFLITNTVVWASSLWYPHTLVGLLACLTAGLPFLGYTIAGDQVSSIALIHGHQCAHSIADFRKRLTSSWARRVGSGIQ